MKSVADTSDVADVQRETGPREYELNPELKRASTLGAWGLSICFVFAMLVDSWNQEDFPWSSFAAVVAVGLVIALTLMWWARHFRFRIDQHGVHRRIFFAWQTWPWGAFGKGNVRRGRLRTSFIFPDMPRFKRKLTIGPIGEEHEESVLKECLAYWKPPESPSTPERIELIPGAPLVRPFTSRQIYADSKGILLTTRAGSKVYSWRDVKQCVFFRISHEHDDFLELRLELPDRRVVLAVDRQNDLKQWRGPSPAIVSAFIRRHVEARRILNAALAGTALSGAEIDLRVERLCQSRDEFTKYMRGMYVFVPACLGMFVWYSWPKNSTDAFGTTAFFVGVTVVAAGYGAMLFGYSYFGRRRFNEEITELLSQRDSLVEMENKEDTRTRATFE